MRLAFRLSRYNRYSFIPLFGFARRFGETLLCNSAHDILECSPHLVFYSFMSPHAPDVYSEVSRLRGMLKGTLFVAGGPHPTALPNEVLEEGFDSVVVGEGEGVFVKLLEDATKGRLKPVYRGSAGDFPLYSLADSPYTGPVELVRGCPFGCRYCQVSYMFGRRPRCRPLEQVLSEAEVLLERGRRFVRFIAPNALSYMSEDGVSPNVEVLRSLFSGLKALGVEQVFFGSFPSEVRPDSVTPEAVELMAQFCSNRRVVVGAQSGSPRMLELMGRGHGVEDVKRAVEILNSFGFEVSLDFIFGLPGETERDMELTLALIEELYGRFRVRVHAHSFLPLPGTPWAKASPAPIPKWVKRRLHMWERQGLLDGNWVQQERMGRVLCRMSA